MKRLSSIAVALLLASLPFAALAQEGSTQRPVFRPPSRPAQGPQTPVDPNKPVPGKFTHPKLKGWINDVPDTGQFLADSVWVLRVGPRVTTAGEFVSKYFSSYPEYRPPQDSLGRIKFLTSLMHKDVLGMTALAQNRPLRFEDRLAIRETRQRALATAVFQRFVADSIVVTEAETRALWESYKWAQRFRHILLPDRNAAERVRRELVSGKITWAAAVKKYSMATNDRGPDGDLGWAQRDKMDRNIGNTIFLLKPGETSLPVQDRQGWHIVQSTERKPQDPPAYEGFRRALKRMLQEKKQIEIQERLLAMLRLQTNMVYDTTNVVFASTKFGESMTVKQEAFSASFEIDGSVPEFAPEDTSRVLATWNGGKFTLGTLLHAFSDIPPLLRPTLNLPDAVFGFVESIVLEPTLAEYGAQKGLEKDPVAKSEIDKKIEELMVEHMYQDSVGSKIWVSKDERKAYYQKHLPDFFTFPSVQFAAIVRHDKAGADSVGKALQAGSTARAIIAADSAKGFVSGSIQTRNSNEGGAYQKALFEEMRPGDIQVRGPDKNGDYAVIQLLSYDGGRQLTFEESETMIDESLNNIKADEALQAFIGRLKKNYEIAWRPELVMLIKLVDPSLED